MTVTAPTLLTFAVALFTIANPIGTIPVFLDLTEKMDSRRQRHVALMVGVGAVVVMLISLFAGTALLTFFGIDLNSFKIAGFAYVATIAWAMMVRPDAVMSATGSSPAIVPLAVPVIAGPGVMALMIAYAHDHTGLTNTLIGVGIAVGISALVAGIYSLAPLLSRLLGATGMNVFSRVFGLILLAICVQSILTALAAVFPSWSH
ncbi:MarC family protein [Serinibacter salmoneus]|uniref:MarC family protein n=1 Tax=Serinibacter salmoneus TaxID=556530 RepID=UPI00147367F7|nr:MarC family protein [Serinibacter salmoneus]